MDYMTLGPTPSEESCAQVGTDDYEEKSRKECKRYRDLILRVCGEPPPGASLAIRSFPHDFGSYREVVVNYDPMDEDAASYALHCEGNSPTSWDGAGGSKWEK
jgi:hypothetical protein